MKEIEQQLFALRDEGYAEFQAKLAPTIQPETVIGVRVPLARKLAKQISGSDAAEAFLQELPHRYYDENMLHGLLLNEEKIYPQCVQRVEAFLPYVDNWAVCDILSPKVFKKHKPELLTKIREWSASKKAYTSRFGMEMLMTHFLDEDFCPEYLEIPAQTDREWEKDPSERQQSGKQTVRANSDEYYVRMMVAWFFATALAKQWEDTILYLEQQRLCHWTHNKTIQKAVESYRITDKQKQYLRSLRV
ncbi:MAG: DNA alkylation repair protein [Lachnospiraceae bacterium]